MTPEETTLLQDLLATQRVLSLAVVVDGVPVSGLLPFAIQPDFSALLVFASSLAKHTAGLYDGGEASFVIHAPDAPASDPFQLLRLTMQTRVNKLPKASLEYADAQSVYTARLPSSQMLFALGDFNLYALVPLSGRFVVGFGRALNLTGEDLRQLA